jgi:4-alpha-glucanotransferase
MKSVASNSSTSPLATLARAVGVAVEWTDVFGVQKRVPEATLQRVLIALGFSCRTEKEIEDSLTSLRELRSLPALLTADAGHEVVLPGIVPSTDAVLEGDSAMRLFLRPQGQGSVFTAPQAPGYYSLGLGAETIRLAVAPRCAPTVADLTTGSRAFGVAAQVYALRRPGDNGIGDLGAVADLAVRLASHGAHALALSPLHALFSAAPDRFSPYSPSSRVALNPLLADPTAVFADEDVAAAAACLDIDLGRQLASSSLVDWSRASSLKLDLLSRLYERLAARAELAETFAAFTASADPDIHRHALFEALHARLVSEGADGDWRRWPPALRSPQSAEVVAFAEAHTAAVRFHLFLQWLADRSLATAQARAKSAGMGIGLIADLAIGLDPAGSQAWGRPADLLAGLTIGAPPDLVNRDGQDWGITAVSSTALMASGFLPFLTTLRAALLHTGGVRIDHALGLNRLWLIPDGALPADGAYLSYPFEDLLRLLALEAHAHGALVIGEDLGTVPQGLREALTERSILGLRVLPFERTEEGSFVPPSEWPASAVAMTSTHDLPTVAGWWQSRDLEWRAAIAGVAIPENAQAQRAEERQAFAEGAAAAAIQPGLDARADTQDVVDAAIAYVAETPCSLALVPLEDLAGLDEAPNIPGTVDEHPNWRRRMPAPAEALLEAPRVVARLGSLRSRRIKEGAR